MGDSGEELGTKPSTKLTANRTLVCLVRDVVRGVLL